MGMKGRQYDSLTGTASTFQYPKVGSMGMKEDGDEDSANSPDVSVP